MASEKPTRKELVAMVWKHCPSTYKGTELLVLVKLAGLTNTTKGYAYPSLYYLSLACGLVPTRGVQKIVARLKKAGVLSIKKSAGGRNRYTLNVEHIRSLPLAVPPDVEEKEEPLPEEKESAAAVKAEPVKPEPAVRRPWDEQPSAVEGRVVYGLQGFHPVGWPEMKNLLADPTQLKEGNCIMWQVLGADAKQFNVKIERNGARGFMVTLPSGQVLEAA
jgi:hypothetical protein